MTETLQEQRERLLKSAISEDPLNQDIIKINPELKKSNFNYNGYNARFLLKMKEKGIEVSGNYINFKSILKFKCKKCTHEWECEATKAQQLGCPECRKFTSNLDKTVKLWERSKKIIRDKEGQILQFPPIDPDKIPSLNDEFILSCKREHTFTFSHLRLREGQWCPICAAKYGVSNEPKSNYAYRRGMTDADKFIKYSEIAEIKGAKILSTNPETGDFKIMCIKCNTTRMISPRGLCANQYICRNRCLRGNKYTIYMDS